ncbi:hypothetical protein D2E26_0162 [Bifidobacterium dolichotidis]|uniref:Uncharacterized protein n=1 Tax=Bifidobacterium dolichotidis TaxID=2306976 RepID=A0A430FRV7_9BIFI|nr:hypothetical protein [Bifidobacterium dolichotidis]RSX55599.1 hypothetical protein D2E26_0162 [Bifidobacterium dolichotidis]
MVLGALFVLLTTFLPAVGLIALAVVAIVMIVRKNRERLAQNREFVSEMTANEAEHAVVNDDGSSVR